MPVRRGCAVSTRPYVRGFAWLRSDQRYHLRCAPNDWLSIEAPGEPRRWCRPAPEPGAAPDIVPAGTVFGRILGVQARRAVHLWVVAFRDDPVFAEARVRGDRTFELPELPAGAYGLRVGDDSERGLRAALESGDAWAGATRVEVQAGVRTGPVLLRWPRV